MSTPPDIPEHILMKHFAEASRGSNLNPQQLATAYASYSQTLRAAYANQYRQQNANKSNPPTPKLSSKFSNIQVPTLKRSGDDELHHKLVKKRFFL